jgi:two-component system, LytTR family, response regulator
MKPFDCIIVDDDEMDRLSVLSYAKRFPSLNIVGVFDTAEKALLFLESNSVSIAFLDIQLQNASGIELRNKALTIPVCVFISSHPENAAETFELQTLDFIVKPFKFARFEQMMKRVEEFMEVRHKASLFDASVGGDAVYVKTGYDQIKVKMHEILYLEALKNYTILVTESKRHCVLTNLGEILQNDKFNSFVRIHKSFAVQKQYIQKISTQEIELNNGTFIPVGRSYKDNINVLL